MESTSVYWIPLYEILEERGFEVILVNARDFKSVPGRKTDVLDCQWLQELHMYGLLRGSFRPDAEIAEVLAEARDFRCKASKETIVESLTGNYRPEHVFALRQAVELYDFYQKQMGAVDKELEKLLHELEETSPVREEIGPGKSSRRKGNEPHFDIRTRLYALAGTDLTDIPAIGPYSALKIVSEIGTYMTRWPTVDHFTSWATLAPRNKITGGKLISSRTLSSANRFAEVLRMAAMTIGKTDSYVGAFYRRKAARIGKAKAITATARKLAVIIYYMIACGVLFHDLGLQAHDEQHRKRVLNNLKKRAKSLSFQLIPAGSLGNACEAVT